MYPVKQVVKVSLLMSHMCRVRSTPSTPNEKKPMLVRMVRIKTELTAMYTLSINTLQMSYKNIIPGMRKIREGYSFLFFDSSTGSKHGIPLTDPGSCMTDFTIQPVMECTVETCEVTLVIIISMVRLTFAMNL